MIHGSTERPWHHHTPWEDHHGPSSKRPRTPSAGSSPEDVQYEKDLKLFNLRNTEGVCSQMIKTMFRYHVLVNHPDKAPHDKKDEFTAKMQEFNNANERLMKRCKLA